MSDEFSTAWSVHKLADFLEGVCECSDERTAFEGAIERAADAFDAEVAAIAVGEDIVVCLGVAADGPAARMLASAAAGNAELSLPDIGQCVTAVAPFDNGAQRLILARRASDPFQAGEMGLLRSMTRVIDLALKSLRLIISVQTHEDQIGAVVRAALDCIVSMDASGNITEWNPAAELTFGYSRDEALGNKMADLIVPPHLREMHHAGMARYLQTGEAHVVDTRIEITAMRRDGTEFPIELTVTVVGGSPPSFTAYIRDISERVASALSVEATTQRLSSLVESLNAAVLVENEDRSVGLVNAGFVEVFAYPGAPGELTGGDAQEVATLIAASVRRPDLFTAATDAIFDAAEPVYNEEVHFRDGRVFERDHIPIAVGDKKVGRLWVYRDVTSRIEFEREMAEARDNALAASRLKSSFLATMSHEIRTPMNGVVGLVDLLLQSPLNHDQRELVRMLAQSADHLMEVIDDILDFSRIEAGELRLEQISFVPAVTVRDVVELFAPRATTAGIELRQSVAPELGRTFVSDPGRIRQILQNLVGNAIKFTREGAVDVRASLEPPSVDGSQILRLSVADTGIGIPADVATRLFEPFTQADASTSRLYGGSGLGLSICQRLAGLLGGTLAVASAPGVGSTFTVRIPLIPAESDNATESPVGGVSSSGTPGTILVVEDNPVNQAVVQRQLDALGHTVITVDGGLRALELLATDAHVDLVLMDCQMPGMDGFTATRRIRELDSGHARLPIVAMTANAMREDRDACLAAGMDDYLAKPVRSDELKQMLDRWIAAGRAAHVAHVPSAPAQPSVAPVIDRSVMDGLVADLGGDPSVIDEFAGIFLRELPTRQAAAVAALADGDRSVLRERAHALRSPSRALGLARLDDVCERIERAAINGNIDTARSLEKELLTACDETAAAISSLIAPGR